MIGGHTINDMEIGGGPPASMFFDPVVQSWIATIIPSPALVPLRTLVGQRTCIPYVSRETSVRAPVRVTVIVGKRSC